MADHKIIGISTSFVGLAIAAVGVVGGAEHHGTALQQRDVALTADADGAHTNLVAAQAGLDHDLFNEQLALQESIYYWVDQQSWVNDTDSLLSVGDAADPQDSIFNGAFSRLSEAAVVDQAIAQVEWDHLLGVNQTLGAGGYETQIGTALQADLGGTNLEPGSDLDTDVSSLLDNVDSYSGFHADLVNLHGDLVQTAVADLLGAFLGDDPAAAAADAGDFLPF